MEAFNGVVLVAPGVAEDTALFLCIRAIAAHELYKTWVRRKDLEDTGGPRRAAILLIAVVIYILLALLETVVALAKHIPFYFLRFWEAADASIDVGYIIMASQYQPSQRNPQLACLYNQEGQVGLSVLQVALLAIFGEPIWMDWIQCKVFGSECGAAEPLLSD
ncbi:MAG: hypothetical protein Q9168_001729 [Polycauliona sp. 1 TL-2023]